MPAAPLPPDEDARLEALHALAILDSPPEPEYDDLTRLAATICGTPIATVSLVDHNRQWFKARLGVDACETHRDLAFCAYAIHDRTMLVVPDAADDERFRDNPLVTGEPGIRFYAGMPLVTPDGHALGTLCVIDLVPRLLTPQQAEGLRVLARQVVAHLQLRRQAAALKESEERFRAFMDNSPAAAFMKGEDGRYAYINEPIVRRFGMPADAWLGHTDEELFPAAYSAAWRDNDRAVLDGGRATEFSESVPMAGGGVSHWTTFKFPFRDAAGRRYLAGIGVDVTEKRQAEDALRHSEERFRAVVSELAEGVVLLDWPTRAVLQANPAFLDLLGYTAAELVGLTQYDFVAHDRADIDEKMAAIAARGRASIGFRKYRRKDGSLVDVTVSGSRMTLDGRDALCLVVQDVTDLKRAEDAVLASEERFRTAFEDAPIGMALVAPDGRWLRVNRSLCEMVGYAPAELLATDFQTITHPDDLDADLELVGRVLAGELATYQMEKRYFHKGGRLIHILLSVSLVRGDAGEPLYFVSQIQDITTRKAAENALRASEAKFRGTVDRLAEGLFVVDAVTRRFADANATVLALLGYTRDELLALDPFTLVADDDRAAYVRNVAAMDEALARDGRYDLGRKHLRRKGGGTVPVDIKVTVVPGDGAGLHAVIVRDVSDELRREAVLFEYQAELEEANAKLRALATTDRLTGVCNRAAFDDRLAEWHERSRRMDRPLSLVMLDVDHFKLFNDEFGHPAGDEVLKAVAARLAATARNTDIVARYGGEEFAVLLPDTDYSGAMVLAERCRRAVAAAGWELRPVTVSVGVATLGPGAGPADLLGEADQALYRSKQAGRNRVSHGSGSFSVAALARG